MRYFIASTWMLVLLLIPGMASTASADASRPVEMEMLLKLLRDKGLLTAEESSAVGRQSAGGAASRSDIKAIIDFLRSKGSISDQEAVDFLQKLTTKPVKEELAAAPAPEKSEPDVAPAVPAFDEDMVRAALNVILVKQGVLGADEAAQIGERIGRKWTKDEESDIIADPDVEIEYHRTTLPKEGLLADVDQLVSQGLLAKDEAERVKARFLRKASLERVTDDIGANLRQDLTSQVEQKIVPIPEWVRYIKLSGDMRLRYEGDFFGDRNADFLSPSNTTTLFNSQIDRERLRIRARLNATAKVNDQLEVGIGMATGNTTEPVSTNATLGTTLNKQNILLDLGYLKWTPCNSFTMWGGRFPNPWFSSDLVWSPNLNFDGAAFSLTPKITSNIDLFLTGGAFPIQEVELSSHDKWLYAGQLGMRYRNEDKLTAKLAVAFYDFDNITGIANSASNPNVNDWSAPQFQQKGNTLFDIDPSSAIKTAYAAEFRELNITGSLDIGLWDPIRVIVLADYVNNIGYDKGKVEALVGSTVNKETEGYQFGLTVGYPQTLAFGQWNAFLFYKHLESDAVVDGFTDSDFHLGGTNAKGWVSGVNFGLGKNAWLTARWLTANEISGPPLSIDVVQFDINARF